MKKFIYTLALIFSTLAYAADPQGIMANVELLSGVTQRAQFLGIENDTVQLGGYIQNKFTVVRIAKNKFKSIVDEKGDDLLNGIMVAPADTSAKNNVATAAMDSATSDTTLADSTGTDSTGTNTATADTTAAIADEDSSMENLTSIQSDKIFVAFEAGGDSILLKQLNDLTARLLLESGEQVQTVRRVRLQDCSDDVCIQNILHYLGANTIYLGKISAGTTADSIALEMTQALFVSKDVPIVHTVSVQVYAPAIMTDAASNDKLYSLVQTAMSRKASKDKQKEQKSYIMVSTDPEDATVSRAEATAICKSPCTFAVEDTGKIVLNAYWSVEKQIWGAQATVKPIPGDTAKILLKLKKIAPEVQVTTVPAEAEIFPGSDEITKKSKAFGKTPNKFYAKEPGMTTFRLRMIGYRDTLVSVYVPPVAETAVNIEMEKMVDSTEIAQQNKWVHDRKMYHVGEAIMGASIAPVIIGAIFAYLGSRDYDDAKTIKNELSLPGTMEGANYQSKVKKNKDYIDKGDTKMTIGASLAGAGLVLFGIGFYIAF